MAVLPESISRSATEGGAVGPGWEGARVGYSIYVVTRNALIGVGTMLLKLNGALATVIGSAAVTQIQPELGQQASLWVQFVLESARTKMSFSEPFPELKIWFTSLIATLERDRNSVAALKQD